MMANVTVEKDLFGKLKDGNDVERYTFKNSNNISVQIINYGGIITQICVPDKNGQIDDICLGFDDLTEYEKRHPYFGCIVGRVANRTAKGRFELDGKTYTLPINNGPNSLHGGINGFDKKLWTATLEGTKLKLAYISEDGEEGFPGEVTTIVTYELTNEDELYIDYEARVEQAASPIMLTNHSYFNLAGHGTKNIYDHMAQVAAESYLPMDETNIPKGEISPVAGTCFDLRRLVRLGDRIKQVNEGQGFDNNFCFGDSGQRKFMARVELPQNGRYLEVYSTEPGVQFYNAHYLTDINGKGGAIYGQHSAFCLETQHYPDSLNQPSFPSIVVRPGETYKHRTWYKFGLIPL